MRRKLFVCAAALIVGILISEYNLLLALIMLMAAFTSYRIKKGESAGRKTEHKRDACNVAGNTLSEVSDAGVNSERVFQRVLICFFILGIVLMSVSQYRSICLDKAFRDRENCFTGRVIAVEQRSAKALYGSNGFHGKTQKQVRYTVRLIEENGKKLSFFKRAKVLVTSYENTVRESMDAANLSNRISLSNRMSKHRPSGADTSNTSVETSYGLLGRLIRCEMTPERADENGNPHCFNYRLHLKSKGIDYISRQDNFEVVREKHGTPESMLYALMRKLMVAREEFLDGLNLDDEGKAVLRGVLFGDTSQMPEETYEEFQNNGTAHVLAVSGLHIGILYGFFRRLTARRKSKGATILMLGFLLAYGCLTMWSVSATRAILFIFIIVIGDVLDRPVDMLTSLATVAIVVIAKNPWSIYGTSFQMSFMAVISICFLAKVMSKVLPEEIGGAVSVQLGMIPFLAYTFNRIPLISIFCNIPVVFALSMAIPFGMAGFASYVILKNSLFFGAVSARVTTMMVEINRFLEFKGIFTAQVCSPAFGVLVFFYLLLFFLSSEFFFVLKNRKKYRTVAVCLALIPVMSVLCGITTATPFDKATGVMVDVGQGDCFHLRVNGDTGLIFDGGGKENRNVGKDVLKPYFLHNGVEKIDAAFVTHLHTDHYKGIEELKECFEVGKVIVKGRAGNEYRVGKEARVKILWPEKQDFTVDDENINSLIFKIHAGGMSILITGDITAEGERAMTEKYRGTDVLRADVLKVAHHGSKYSSTEEFLDAVKPKVAMIGVGKNNYGHPSDEVIEKLKEKGIITYRTDVDGAIGIRKEKGRITVCRQRTEKNRDIGTLPWILKRIHSETRY